MKNTCNSVFTGMQPNVPRMPLNNTKLRLATSKKLESAYFPEIGKTRQQSFRSVEALERRQVWVKPVYMRDNDPHDITNTQLLSPITNSSY